TLSQNAAVSGSTLLTFFAENTYSGGTVINSGTVALSNSVANSTGLGSGSVTLRGGALKLFSNGGSSTSAGTFSNPIQVDSNFSGTLIGFGRGTLASPLTGSGTLNFQADYVRADVTGDWSGFAGKLNVTKGPNGGDFRIASAAGMGNAWLDLASGVNAYSRAAT